ncbi:glycoside hydrolase family 47 protein [Aspergillus chevalieri]|uniref:alpha-1,2-Mannosidase n=1 Tax=Aspergillus chevalieri TaxID=182096 RepID=A0A7R7VFI2_ASPCH|nr:mannosyl-oligosaccharide alpha-1,2-mannosidase [Aspergillus chevalieri]BCR83773.1 mannosyl-oligosaccharide alpha-1,2-mannosidase [Aspergillus chevalieri]
MSYSFPQATPSFPSQHPYGDNYWRAASRSPNGRLPGYGLSGQPTGLPSPNRLSPFLNNNRATLPLYKDKPYFAPKRTGPRSRRRKALYGGIALFILMVLWYCLSGPTWNGRVKTPDSAKGAELWEWVQGLEKEGSDKSGKQKNVDWDARRERVRDAFIVSWDGYEKYGWGFDEFSPIAKKGTHMIPGGLGYIIVDALDTMMIMNLTSRVQHARDWIQNSLHYDQDSQVNTFETTIRILGGLLSAHYISTKYPNLAPISDDDTGSPGEDLYIEKAADLADRLLGAFDSQSGVPFAGVNLNTSEGVVSQLNGGASSTAEATALQLEFKYLAKLTGESEYWQVAEKVMQVVDNQKVEDGLVPAYIHPDGKFRGESISVGNRGDSYYEYLIKQYLQTSELIYKDMWDQSLMGIRKHLVTYSQQAQLTILGERPDGLRGSLIPKMDHPTCFLPGTIALGVTGGLPLSDAKKSPEWSRRQDEEMLLAQELMKTCWATYLTTKTGLAPEIASFATDQPPKTMTDMYPPSLPLKSVSQSLDTEDKSQSGWRADIQLQNMELYNLQRPETIESLFYIYRITGDETYREWGWEIFKSFMKHTPVVEYDNHYRFTSQHKRSDGTASSSPSSGRIVGFTSLDNANIVPPLRRDNMEGCWLSETLKYFYLLFSDREFIPLEDHVFNTEAHPFPRFQPSGELRTGWKRQER